MILRHESLFLILIKVTEPPGGVRVRSVICKHGEYLPPKLGDHDQASTNFVVASDFVRNERYNNMSSSIAYFIPGCNRFYEKLRLKSAQKCKLYEKIAHEQRKWYNFLAFTMGFYSKPDQ
jgi:hypothetical protein